MKHAKRLLAGVLAALLLSTTLAPAVFAAGDAVDGAASTAQSETQPQASASPAPTETLAKQKAVTLVKATMVIRVLACYTK